MIRTPPQHNTINPPGQIVNLEVPLTKAIEAFRDDQQAGLVRRVQQLEAELKYLRQRNLSLHVELENTKKNFSNF